MHPDTAPTTIDIDQLDRVTGGAFEPSVKNCKAAYDSGKITNSDLKKFADDRSYPGTTVESKACLGKAASGGFGFSEKAVKERFGVKD